MSTVLDIHADATPYDRNLVQGSDETRYVLEVPAGQAARDGMEPGLLLHWDCT